MLAGHRNGFVVLSERLKSQLYSERANTLLPSEDFLEGKSYLSFCFEPQHFDLLSFGSLNHNVKLLCQLYLKTIEKKIHLISSQARVEFHSRGLIKTAELERKPYSSIISITLSSAINEKLNKANIISTRHSGSNRFSFHFYNNMQDLEKLLEVIDGKRA